MTQQNQQQLTTQFNASSPRSVGAPVIDLGHGFYFEQSIARKTPGFDTGFD